LLRLIHRRQGRSVSPAPPIAGLQAFIDRGQTVLDIAYRLLDSFDHLFVGGPRS